MKRPAAVLLFTVTIAALSVGGRARPSAQNQNDQTDVWEITVSATSHSHTHGFSSAPNEQRLLDTDLTYLLFLTERLHGTLANGRIELGEGDPIDGGPTGSGSASETSHSRKVDVKDLQEQWITRDGSLDPPPSGGGAHFAWDASTHEAMFEASAHYSGTMASVTHVIFADTQTDRTDRSSDKFAQSALFGGDSKHPVTVGKTKTGFAIDWSWSETTHDPNGQTKEVEQSGHADVHRYVQHQPMELVVSPAGYQTWLPQAGNDQKTPGNRLAVLATLKTKNGKPIPDDQKAARIRFQLTDVSREPGVCMNFPLAAVTISDDPDPDLQFTQAGGMKLTPADHPDTAETPDGQDGLTSASAVVAAYDWGAWGSLRVTAQLDDGELIVGHLDGKADTEILLPRRKSRGEHTAAYWKEQRGISLPDDDDSEKLAEPPNTGTPGHAGAGADQHPGDGYTVYEEYRGFMENGTHIFGDPTRKDLMVRDAIGGRSKDGTHLFEAITGILVHDQFTDEEFENDHLMNGNYNLGAHDVDQHGLMLINGIAKDYSVAEGTPGGSPGQHTAIAISAGLSPGPDGWNVIRQGRAKVLSDDYAATIAHEMLHGCAVLHHGESDPGSVLWMKGPDGGGGSVIIESGYTLTGNQARALDDGHAVDVRYESGARVSPDLFANGGIVWIGITGGQHSGFSNCVMRYDVAEAYTSSMASPVRYYVHEETGVSLCDAKADAPGGVNSPDHQPQSRYGNASQGDCFHQIKVKDGGR